MIVAIILVSALSAGQSEETSPPVVWPAAYKRFVDLFEAREYHCSAGQDQPVVLKYRLFVPRNLDPTRRYPLILWLHGLGEGGKDNHRSLKYVPMIFNDLEHAEKYRFFFLVPQCPSAHDTWTSKLDSTSDKDMLTATHEMLQEVMREQPVDPDRVSLIGICSGGGACWSMGQRYPDTFAAIVPTNPGCGDLSQAARLAHIPIWAFQFEYPEIAKDMMDAVKQAGGNIHLTTASYQAHDAWSVAIEKCDIVTWMTAQRRNAWICLTPPGHRPWQWWHILTVPSVFAGLVGVAWMSERKRRQRRKQDQLTIK